MFENLPAADQAEARIQKVAADIFFRKLASYGVVPETEAEAADLLKMAEKLNQANATIAKPNTSKYASDVSQLDELFGSQDQTSEIQKIAKSMAQDPELLSAVVAIKQAQADSVREQLSAV